MKKWYLPIVALFLNSYTGFAQEQEQDSVSVFTEEKMYTESQKGFLLSVNGSYGINFVGRNEYYNDWERDYRKKNNKGLALDVALYYKLDNFNCIGLIYSNYSVEMEAKHVPAYAPGSETGYLGIRDVRNDFNVSYYAFSYMVNFRLPENLRHEFNLEQGIGYVRLNEDAYYPELYTIKAGGVGFLSSFSYRYEIINNFVIGPRIAYFSGLLFDHKVKGPDGYTASISLLDDDRRGINRLDLGLSACYRF